MPHMHIAGPWLLLACLTVLPSCSTYKAIEPSSHPLQRQRVQARRAMGPLDVNVPNPVTPYMQQYLEFYDLVFDAIDYQHTFGTFTCKGYTLAAHIFQPRCPRGTVFAVHGYMDHTGILRHLIRYCLSHDYTVVTFDLPGHGLSSGDPVSISSFSEYADILDGLVDLCTPMVTRPFHLVGHCIGSAIALEYLSGVSSSPFAKVALITPFVRSPYWYPVKLGFYFGRLTHFKTVGRRYSQVSSDPVFLEFYRNDPLQFNRLPIAWITAMYQWEKHIQTLPLLQAHTLVIQGTVDGVVDGAYNIPFLRRKISDLQVDWIQGGRHQLLNESEPMRTAVLKLIVDFLNDDENR